jgi:hypothetical protein
MRSILSGAAAALLLVGVGFAAPAEACNNVGGSCTGGCCAGTECYEPTNRCEFQTGHLTTCSGGSTSNCVTGVCSGSPLGACDPGGYTIPCFTDRDCASGYGCDVYTETCKIAGGASCTGSSQCDNDQCAPTTCVVSGAGYNTPCWTNSDCASPGECFANGDFSGSPQAGLCVVPVGGACVNGSDCASGDCGAGSVCVVAASGQCVTGVDCGGTSPFCNIETAGWESGYGTCSSACLSGYAAPASGADEFNCCPSGTSFIPGGNYCFADGG